MVSFLKLEINETRFGSEIKGNKQTNNDIQYPSRNFIWNI